MRISKSILNDESVLKSSLLKIVTAFVVFFVSILAFGFVSSKISTPDVLTLLPQQIPQLLAVGAVLLSLHLIFEISLYRYGLKIDRTWFVDAIAGIFIGVVFQGISTILLIYFGDAMITDSWTMGVFPDYNTVILALISTSIAFLIVALGEDLIFRGILIREITEVVASFDVSRKSSTLIALLGSSILFSVLHFSAGAEGLSTSVVILQALVGGIYFGIAYAITDSLAIPIGIHFSTNIWTTVVFGQPGDGYPAAFIVERSVKLEADLLITLILPACVLISLTIIWVNITRQNQVSLSLSSIQ